MDTKDTTSDKRKMSVLAKRQNEKNDCAIRRKALEQSAKRSKMVASVSQATASNTQASSNQNANLNPNTNTDQNASP